MKSIAAIDLACRLQARLRRACIRFLQSIILHSAKNLFSILVFSWTGRTSAPRDPILRKWKHLVCCLPRFLLRAIASSSLRLLIAFEHPQLSELEQIRNSYDYNQFRTKLTCWWIQEWTSAGSRINLPGVNFHQPNRNSFSIVTSCKFHVLDWVLDRVLNWFIQAEPQRFTWKEWEYNMSRDGSKYRAQWASSNLKPTNGYQKYHGESQVPFPAAW